MTRRGSLPSRFFPAPKRLEIKMKSEPTNDPRCGTYKGYRAHRTRRENPCIECKEVQKTYSAKYQKDNREKVAAYKVIYRKNNLKKHASYQTKYYQANKKTINEKLKNKRDAIKFMNEAK